MSSFRTPGTYLLFSTIAGSVLIASGAAATPPVLEPMVILDAGTHPPEFASANWNFGGAPISGVAIDENGRVAFTGVIFGAGIIPANNRVIWHGEPNNWSVLARAGEPSLPGISGLTFASLNTSPPVLAPNGQVSVFGTLAGSGVTTANDTAAWFGPASSLGLLAREGDSAPGTSGATLSGNVAIAASTRANNAGNVLVTASLTGGDTVTANNSAIYLASTSGLTKVWRKGDPAPASVPGAFISHDSGNVQFNGSNTVVTTGALTGGTPAVTTSNDGIYFAIENGTPRIIARENDPIPGYTDVTYKITGSFTPATRAINNNGKILFNVLAFGPSITTANDSIWLVDDAGTITTAIQEGQLLGPGTFSVVNLQNILLNNNDRIAFSGTSATLTGNPACLWEGQIGGPYTTIVTTGDAAPGLSGVTLNFAIGASLSYNDANQIVFFSTLAGTGVTAGVNDRAVFVWDVSHGIQMVARTGTTTIGSLEYLAGLSLLSGSTGQNGECGSVNFTNNGWLAFTATDADGYQAIVRTNLALECNADVNGDDVVNITDLLAVIINWGACADPEDCPADTNGDDVVDINDLLAVIISWGPCL